MIQRILAFFRHADPEPEPDPYGLKAAFAWRKELRSMGYQRPERRRG